MAWLAQPVSRSPDREPLDFDIEVLEDLPDENDSNAQHIEQQLVEGTEEDTGAGYGENNEDYLLPHEYLDRNIGGGYGESNEDYDEAHPNPLHRQRPR